MEKNPFRDGSSSAAVLQPSVIVILGATGDLTHRKLVPALYNLEVDGLLPGNFYLVGAARRDIGDSGFREGLKEAVDEHSRRTPVNEHVWAEFAKNTFYVQVPFKDPEGYKRLREKLEAIDDMAGSSCQRIFYLAAAPEHFEPIAAMLSSAGLLSKDSSHSGSNARIIVEKPFGRNLSSAQELNVSLSQHLNEERIFRIDHYLGKETVQNLLVFRFANGIFEPIWNRKYIDHVEISVAESIGVEGRAGYFDTSGIIRDIVQNHAFQLFCLVAMEPPIAFEAEAVRDEKVKVLRAVRRLKPYQVSEAVVRGQYTAGAVDGKIVSGYLEEEGVGERSLTETFAALKIFVENWRWAGVPFYIRAGKRLAKRVTDISIFFKQVPHVLFRNEDVGRITPNVLSFQIQPDESISFRIACKPPGTRVRVQNVNMDFSYGASFGVEPPEAYERLLIDAIRGDATLFTRSDEIEEAWEILEPVFQVFESDEGADSLPSASYVSGSWGPSEADALLIRNHGVGWRRL